MACARTQSLLEHFSALKDPRQSAKVLYPLPEILLLVLCATLAGANDFVAIRLWGTHALPFLRRFLPYRDGLPSHDTLNDIMNTLDPELFKNCFLSWVETLRSSPTGAKGPEIIAVDGKTSRRSHNRAQGREPLHLVSAWACRQRLVLGQEATAEKSNEITAIPRLLERLALEGALVTIDAIGTQTEIARTIRGKGGDYLLALKENWPATYAEVETVFADPDSNLERSDTVDADHGRTEGRSHAVCHDVSFLYSDRRHPGEFAMPDVAMIGMVESHTERSGKIEQERRYYLCSADLDVETFARAVRTHWHIENRLHWILDVVFYDDLARLRTGYGPENMAVIKHMALNLLQKATPIASFKNRRHLAGWSLDYLENVLRQLA